ncbi:hypothetical protein [Nocardia fluminea]|uniref:hypothetical protein n=1 Tax=Nocardia fluminea TaxID=134984 RepID=UPI0033DFDF55
MSDQLRHSAQSMVHAVKMWRAAAADLQTGSAMVEKLELSPKSNVPVQPGVTTGGPFDEALSKYKPAPAYFRDRLNEGVVVFNEIANALEEALRQYAESDDTFAAEVRRLTGQIG